MAQEAASDPSRTVEICGREDETIELGGAEAGAEDSFRDVSISKIKKCTIVVRDVLQALRLRDMEDCFVYCGPVRGSVYVERCVGCTFFTACRQVRSMF